MALSLEECDAMEDISGVGIANSSHKNSIQNAPRLSQGSLMTAKNSKDSIWYHKPPSFTHESGVSSIDSVFHIKPPSFTHEPSPPTDSLKTLQSSPVREGDAEAQIQEEIVSEFQKSTFCRWLAQRVQYLLDESKLDHLQDEITQLRTENGRLRAQFVKNGMELPGAIIAPPAPLPEKNYDQEDTICVTDTCASQPWYDVKTWDHWEPQSEGPMMGREISMREVQAAVSTEQGKFSAGSAVIKSLQRFDFSEKQERSRDIKELARRASIWNKQNKENLCVSPRPEVSFIEKTNRHLSRRATQKTVFADSEAMKQQVRKACIRQPYHVSQFYKDTGLAAAVAGNIFFEYFTLFVILVNSVWIAIDTDLNKEQSITEAEWIFQVAEYFFIIYFMMEWTVRFSAFENKWNCLRDSWMVFDSFLVVLMLIDIISIISSLYLKGQKSRPGDASILKLFRMLRITRTARMARLLKALPELTILVKGIFVAARSVFFTLVLLCLIIYVFAVAFTQITEDTQVGSHYFRSVGYSMKALLLYATLPDMAQFVDELGDEHVVLAICLLVFILLATLTVMNMLVGVLVEVVSVVSAVEKEELLVTVVKRKLLDMMTKSGLDADEDMMISRYEFEMLLVVPQAAKVIQDVGVDPVGLVDFADHIFRDHSSEEKLTFSEFVDLVLELRGGKQATVKDVVDLRKMLMKQMEYIEKALSTQDRKLNEITEVDFESKRSIRQTNNVNFSPSIVSCGKSLPLHPLPNIRESKALVDPSATEKEAPNGLFGITPAPPQNPCPKVGLL